ncbi:MULTISPECIES: penicillinase repressor BlaI [Metabacillus]|uniref:penicillinase repressor BlaI n=1 Tax=Metabacillus TaxID=2675233 RepID=UPI0004937704|nr:MULTISPECIES: penicillinase repressor BlaI [Metabacillus]KEZ46994.1 beta-lactamase [Metabacillus indicus LMG 22858]
MEKSIPSISESEWEIMNVLWDKAPRTASDIISSLQESSNWKPKTIRTLLDRLVQKDVVGVNKNLRVYTFYPLYTQEECQRAETESFINRIYGGTLKSMLVQFIQEDTLSDDDINELRFMLNKKPEK